LATSAQLQYPGYIAVDPAGNLIIGDYNTAGAAVDHPDNDGWTALTVAAQNGHDTVVAHLLAAGATVDYATNDGRTAPTPAARKVLLACSLLGLRSTLSVSADAPR
jgi:ankyrin repeat protein